MKPIVIILFVGVGITPIFSLGLIPLELDWNACPTPRTVQNFKPLKFIGTWYDIQRFQNPIFTGHCGIGNYAWNNDNEILNLTYTNLDYKEYITLLPKDLSNGLFRLNRGGRRTPLILHILETDYENYSIIWTCTDVLYGVGNTQTLNIFSRTPKLDRALLVTALNAITSRNLDDRRLLKVDQDRNSCQRDYK